MLLYLVVSRDYGPSPGDVDVPSGWTTDFVGEMLRQQYSCRIGKQQTGGVSSPHQWRFLQTWIACFTPHYIIFFGFRIKICWPSMSCFYLTTEHNTNQRLRDILGALFKHDSNICSHPGQSSLHEVSKKQLRQTGRAVTKQRIRTATVCHLQSYCNITASAVLTNN